MQRGGKTTTFGYDSRGIPDSIYAAGIVHMKYNFDTNVNLHYRIDKIAQQKEELLYDGMNRLTNWDIYQNNVLVKPNNMVYNTNTGTITSKSDLNNLTMLYGENGKPHALTGISGVPTNFPTDSLNVTYTDFRKIKTLTEDNNYYILTYGIDDQRRKSEYKLNGVTQKTKYYLGDYEEETDNLGNTKKIHYLSGGAILINTNGVETLYYGYSDYQGNLIALANEAGTVVERYTYDPWGKRRNPADWTQDDTRTSWIIDRGYTMHEHLDQFGIINMNGRVYDPLTAMFFSPDPFVQAPWNWLNFNRYAYCYGNPFKYTDPDGEVIFTVLSIIFFPAALPYAVMADIGWMSEYASQVSNNMTMTHPDGTKYSKKDIFVNKIDWFDVGIAGVSNAVSVIPGMQWIGYATPFVSNGINWYGNGDFQSIFGGKTISGKDEKIHFGVYLVNAILEDASIAGTYLFKSTLGKNSTKDILKDISPRALSQMPKKELWEIAGKQLWNNFKYDYVGSFAGKLSQEGFKMRYDETISNQKKIENSPYNPGYHYRIKSNGFNEIRNDFEDLKIDDKAFSLTLFTR